MADPDHVDSFDPTVSVISSLKSLAYPVWLRNRLVSAGLKPVVSQTEELCVSSNTRQFL